MSRFLLLLSCLTCAATAAPLTPFPLTQVRINQGIFLDSMLVNDRVMDEIGVERALYCFRFNAKLPVNGAKPLEGWGTPEPQGAFPGAYEGHYLSALAQLAAATGDPRRLGQLNYMVAELAKCQDALGGGFLFASPAGEFDPDRLDGVVWYRMHKLMEGLVDAHRHAGNAQALDILNRLAGWIDGQMKTYQGQWDKVKKVEYGGMSEALENLYEITRNPRHHELALAWEEREKILDNYFHRKDFNEHANTLLARMVGTARIAEVSHDEYHRIATANFWDFTAGSGQKTYATGGTSIHEGMPGIRVLANSQARMPQETCVSHNLLKVTRSLFHLSGDPSYLDYCERTLFNSILGSQDPRTGWKSYYQPLNANTLKDFRSHLTGCYCCNGTGLENPAQYGAGIYSHQGMSLRVNLFIASTLTWSEQGLQLRQETRFPSESDTTLHILQTTSPTEREIGIRVPAWCQSGFTVTINGEAQKLEAKPATYVLLKRLWKAGDSIHCQLPMTFSSYPMPDQPSQMAFLYGPLVMVGVGARPWLAELVGDLNDQDAWPNHLNTWFQPVPGQPLAFTARDSAKREIRFEPYYSMGADSFFTGYWDVVKTPVPHEENNLALGKPTSTDCPDPSGVNVESFMRSGKAVDGQYGGPDDWYVKWFPNGNSPHWLTVDLTADCEITGTEWFLSAEDIKAKIPYRYRIDTSSDNQTWQTFADHSQNNDFFPTCPDQKSVMARYVRLTLFPMPGRQGNESRAKVAEFKVFGKRTE